MPISGGRSADRRTSCRCKIAVPEITPPDIQIRDLTEIPNPTIFENDIALRYDIGEALDPLDQVIDDQFADAGKVVGILFDAFAAGQEKIGQALTAATGIPEFAGSYNSAAETTRSIGDSAEGIIAMMMKMKIHSATHTTA